MSLGFPTKSDSNKSAQLQRLARILKPKLLDIAFILNQRTDNKDADQSKAWPRGYKT